MTYEVFTVKERRFRGPKEEKVGVIPSGGQPVDLPFGTFLSREDGTLVMQTTTSIPFKTVDGTIVQPGSVEVNERGFVGRTLLGRKSDDVKLVPTTVVVNESIVFGDGGKGTIIIRRSE